MSDPSGNNDPAARSIHINTFLKQRTGKQQVKILLGSVKYMAASLFISGFLTWILVTFLEERKSTNEMIAPIFFVVMVGLFCYIGAWQFKTNPSEENAAFYLGGLIPLVGGFVIGALFFLLLNVSPSLG